MVLLVEVALILALVLFNGVLAMSELAIVSARRPRLQAMADAGHRGARVALELAADPTRFLSTVQVGITLVGILTGVFGGAALGDHLAELLEGAGVDAAVAAPLAVGLVVLSITYLSLVVGELVPKRLALLSPERLAARMAPPLRALSRLAHPFVRVLELSTAALVRVLGAEADRGPAVTDEEVHDLLAQGTAAGVFSPGEQALVENVLWLGDQRVRSLMTPRPDVVWLDLDAPREEMLARVRSAGVSYFPAARGSLDRVEGIVRAKDLLEQVLSGQPADPARVLQPALVVPATLPAMALLAAFRDGPQHAAVVAGERGETVGFVTLGNVLDAVADVPSADAPSAVRRADGSVLVDGGLDLDDAEAWVGPLHVPPDERRYYQTLGGFVMARAGRVPAAGEAVEWAGRRFEVVDLDGLRIDKVLVTALPDGLPLPDAPSPGPPSPR